MLEALTQASPLTDFISSRQRSTMGALPEVFQHPAAHLPCKYIDESIMVHTGPSWPQRALERAIVKGPYSSVCTPEMKVFIRKEM